MHSSRVIVVLLFSAVATAIAQNNTVPEYVHQCKADDPELTQCITKAVLHFKPWLSTGIPEIELPSIEPFRADQLSLSLSSGPNGYKIVLKDLEIYGVSNFSISEVKLGTQTKPFEVKLKMPHLHILARYTSSGVLIILPASGNGNFFADFYDVDATATGLGVRQRGVSGSKSGVTNKDEEYLQINDLVVDLNIKKVHMNVKKIFNNNRILTEATNLFLRENGHEVLRHMMPQLRRKISSMFSDIANKLLANVPINVFLI